MIDYLDYDQLENNSTGHWNASGNQTLYEEKAERAKDNYERAKTLVKMVQDSTRLQLSFLQPQI